MKTYSKDCLLENNGRYLFTILLLATVSIMGYSIEKAYSELEDPQLDGPAMDSEKR